MFACLADRRRRILLDVLSENGGPVVVEELVEQIHERERTEFTDTPSDDTLVGITVALYHNHLPMMSEAGVIDVDHETNTVREGDRYETAMELLRVV